MLENSRVQLCSADKNIVLLNDDILTTDAVPPNSVDLIVTSPHYNADVQYNSHKDNLSYEEYLNFTRAWLSRCLVF